MSILIYRHNRIHTIALIFASYMALIKNPFSQSLPGNQLEKYTSAEFSLAILLFEQICMYEFINIYTYMYIYDYSFLYRIVNIYCIRCICTKGKCLGLAGCQKVHLGKM